MEIPPLPSPLRRSPANSTANLAEAVLVQWARRFRNVEGQTGLTPERIELLALLEREGELTAGELARELRVSRPAITRMLKGLEEDAFIRREANQLDGRSIITRLTSTGLRALHRGRANRVRAMAERLRGRSERDLAQLEQGLRILGELLEN